MKRLFSLICFLLLVVSTVYPQQLKVTLSDDKNKVHRETGDGVATVIFESSVKDLEITSNMGEQPLALPDGMTFFLIQPESEEYVRDLGYPRRRFYIKTPKTAEYVLDTPEILPNTVTYYTITLPNQFPLTLTAEYLLTKSARHGIRLSFGRQFGGYISYKWGEYAKSGNNINSIHIDVDVSQAEELGYIRKSLTGGARFGILYKRIHNQDCGLYLLIGGGYGEYGRQWKNPTQIEGNTYFYTDYMRGFNGEVAVNLTLCDWISLSCGADMIIDKKSVSVDYMLGLGINLNFTKFRKR